MLYITHTPTGPRYIRAKNDRDARSIVDAMNEGADRYGTAYSTPRKTS